jgi:hypothetical protein
MGVVRGAGPRPTTRGIGVDRLLSRHSARLSVGNGARIDHPRSSPAIECQVPMALSRIQNTVTAAAFPSGRTAGETEQTGRPLGTTDFIAGLERILGRPIARRAPGRKPKQHSRDQPELL